MGAAAGATTQHAPDRAIRKSVKAEGLSMPKAHIRDGELRIALSDKLRAKLAVREGEELEAHVSRAA